MQNYEYQSHISDFLFEEWKRFNDIKIREILKVEEYQEEPAVAPDVATAPQAADEAVPTAPEGETV